MLVEAPPLTCSRLMLAENSQSVTTQLYDPPLTNIKHVESTTQHKTCSMTRARMCKMFMASRVLIKHV